MLKGKWEEYRNSGMCITNRGSFNLCQLFENQVVKVSKKGWHSLKYCVMVILCINKRLTICLIKKYIKNKKSETLRKKK